MSAFAENLFSFYFPPAARMTALTVKAAQLRLVLTGGIFGKFQLPLLAFS